MRSRLQLEKAGYPFAGRGPREDTPQTPCFLFPDPQVNNGSPVHWHQLNRSCQPRLFLCTLLSADKGTSQSAEVEQTAKYNRKPAYCPDDLQAPPAPNVWMHIQHHLAVSGCVFAFRLELMQPCGPMWRRALFSWAWLLFRVYCKVFSFRRVLSLGSLRFRLSISDWTTTSALENSLSSCTSLKNRLMRSPAATDSHNAWHAALGISKSDKSWRPRRFFLTCFWFAGRFFQTKVWTDNFLCNSSETLSLVAN